MWTSTRSDSSRPAPNAQALTRLLWERPCVAIGLRSSPRISAVMHELLGPPCGPFATQGRSHSLLPQMVQSCYRAHKKTGCKSRFSYAPKKLMHDFQKNVIHRNKQLIQTLSYHFRLLIQKQFTSYPQMVRPSVPGGFPLLAAANPWPAGSLRSTPRRGR